MLVPLEYAIFRHTHTDIYIYIFLYTHIYIYIYMIYIPHQFFPRVLIHPRWFAGFLKRVYIYLGLGRFDATEIPIRVFLLFGRLA